MGQLVPLAGFTRGLAIHGPYAFIGLSKIRETNTFGGLPIAERLDELKCGVAVVDLRRGQVVGLLEFQTAVEEIFAVEVLPGVRFPEVLGFQQETIQHTFIVPREGQPVRTPERRSGKGGQVMLCRKPAAESKEKDIVANDQEPELSALTPVTPALHGIGKTTLQHAESRFRLPTLAVGAIAFGQALLHPAAEITGGWLRRWSTNPRRNEGAHVVDEPSVTMVALRIKTGVRQHRIGPRHFQGGVKQGHEPIRIGARSPADKGCHQQMTMAVKNRFEFGKTAVKHAFFARLARLATADVVGAAAAQVQSGRVHRQALQAPLASHTAPHNALKELFGLRLSQEPPAGLLQGRKVRYAVHRQIGAHRVKVLEDGHHAPVIGAKKRFQHQTNEELSLGVFLWAKTMRVQG